jgi:hypothetical protein
MALDPRYADKLKQSAQLIKDSDRLLLLAKRELFPDSPSFDPEQVRAAHSKGSASAGPPSCGSLRSPVKS